MFQTLFSILFASCALDKQALRQEDQEKKFLFESAQRHWEGLRWKIPERAAAFYEDPLVRARKEGVIKADPRKITDVDVLHVVLDEKKEEESQNIDWLRTGTVIVRVEAFGLSGKQTIDEIEQKWYRTDKGWWVELPKEK